MSAFSKLPRVGGLSLILPPGQAVRHQRNACAGDFEERNFAPAAIEGRIIGISPRAIKDYIHYPAGPMPSAIRPCHACTNHTPRSRTSRRSFTNSYCADIILEVSFWACDSARFVNNARSCFAFRLSSKKRWRKTLRDFTIFFRPP